MKMLTANNSLTVDEIADKLGISSRSVCRYIDIFRMNSDHTTSVTLKLNLCAATLLVEEFPLASKYLTKLSENEWMLITDVCSMDGVGRFVMGLLDGIEIVELPELQKYIVAH